MRLIMNVKEERDEGGPCFWNSVVFAITTAADNDITAHFENITIADVEYILPVISESVTTGRISLQDGVLIYTPCNTSLYMDLKKEQKTV